MRPLAFRNGPLPIGRGQTISQHFIVALMSDLVLPVEGGAVLEVGTGCGYQTAVLAELVEHIYSLEIIPELAFRGPVVQAVAVTTDASVDPVAVAAAIDSASGATDTVTTDVAIYVLNFTGANLTCVAKFWAILTGVVLTRMILTGYQRKVRF